MNILATGSGRPVEDHPWKASLLVCPGLFGLLLGAEGLQAQGRSFQASASQP